MNKEQTLQAIVDETKDSCLTTTVKMNLAYDAGVKNENARIIKELHDRVSNLDMYITNLNDLIRDSYCIIEEDLLESYKDEIRFSHDRQRSFNMLIEDM